MVKKLFKHEILSYLRAFIPIQLVLIGIALLNRIVQFFENDTTIYSIVNISSIISYVIAILAAIVLTFIFSITRFYKNMFTYEGYLTLTLPITPSQHIIVKSVTALLFQVANVVLILFSLTVVTSGEMLIELIKAGCYLFNMGVQKAGAHFYFYILEFIVFILLATIESFLFFYACISIGQLSSKNRVLAAVGVYFAFYFLEQIVSTIIIVVLSLSNAIKLLEELTKFILKHPYAFGHILLCALILLALILAVVYFIVVKLILKHKLNLE